MNGFMIRQSALKDGWYYIDFDGEFEVPELSRKTKITENVINHIYQENSGEFDVAHSVYYFPKHGYAADAVQVLNSKLKNSNVTRRVELTEEEIEYIRKALINEDSNIIFTNNQIRTSIFTKLNR